MINLSPLLLFATTLLLGLRHGIDWDHIAAISDITSSTPNHRQSFLLGTMYALGHALVILILGLLAIILGLKLPSWVDSLMEPLVGLTLIFLGVYLIFSIIKHGKNIRLKSRWMLAFTSLLKIYDRIESKITHRHTHTHFHYPENFNIPTALFIGAVHGIGAETPTQLLLFITAASAGGQLLGTLLVITFVLGLITSNSLIIIFSILGISRIQQNSTIYLFIAGVTAIFSLIVGLFFITGQGALLPLLPIP